MEERIDELEEKLEQKDERIEELETRLRKHGNPHTPPSKRRSGTGKSPTSQDDDVRTDGGTPGRKDGHDPEWRSTSDPDEEVEVTSDCCPECGQHLDESGADAHRLVEEIPDPQAPEVTQYNRYQCDSCGTETVATHPDCPD